MSTLTCAKCYERTLNPVLGTEEGFLRAARSVRPTVPDHLELPAVTAGHSWWPQCCRGWGGLASQPMFICNMVVLILKGSRSEARLMGC